MEPCLRFGLIVSFLQLQDAATRTPSLPAGWWILNGNRKKKQKNDANIILLLWFFFQGIPDCFQHTVATMIKLSTARSPHSFGTEGSYRRRRWQVLHISNLTKNIAAKKNATEHIAFFPSTFGEPHHAADPKETPHWEQRKWIEMVQKWLDLIASSASGSLVHPGSLLLKNPFQDDMVHINFYKIKIIISNTLGTRPRSSGA